MKWFITIVLAVFIATCYAQQYRNVPELSTLADTPNIITSGIPDAALSKTDKQKQLDALLRPNKPNTIVLTWEDISKMAVTDIRDIQALAPGIYQRRRGEAAFPVGGRPGEIEYVIDGILIPVK